MTDLATEEARAMSGRPAWRVAAACIKGVACPRCGMEKGWKCISKTTCRERVWMRRALERMGACASGRDTIGQRFAPFLDATHVSPTIAEGARIWYHPQAREWRLPDESGGIALSDSALDLAIRGGLVRLTISGGIMPVWVVTEWGGQLATEWAASVLAAEPSAQPTVPPVDAAAATQAFLERGNP